MKVSKKKKKRHSETISKLPLDDRRVEYVESLQSCQFEMLIPRCDNVAAVVLVFRVFKVGRAQSSDLNSIERHSKRPQL